jgi:hypothetical protein
MKKYYAHMSIRIIPALLFIITFGLMIPAHAQQQVMVSDMHPELRYYPLKGTVYYNDYIQIKGTAFLSGEDWMKGDLVLTDGRIVPDITFKIDIYAHRVLVYHEYLKRIISVSKEDLRELTVKDSESSRKFVFLKNITNKAKVFDGCYYEELSEGSISLYKLYYKDVLPLRSPEMPLLDEFLDEESYFLLEGETVEGIRLNKRVLFRRYPQQKAELKQLIRKNDLHLRKEGDFIVAISFLSIAIGSSEENQ